MGVSWTRRAFLSAIPAAGAAAAENDNFPSERVRFADSATENEVWRLTNPAFTSLLPPSWARSSSSRGGFLVYASDRTGTMQAFRMELRSGESRLLTSAQSLQPASLSLTPDEKSVVYFDGRVAQMQPLSGGRPRDLGEAEADRGLALSEDSQFAAWFNGDELTVANLGRSSSRQAIRATADARFPVMRPKRAGLLYRREQGLWLVSFDGSENRRLRTAAEVSAPQWSPDGRSILYLSGNELREHIPDTNTDSLLARTSQFSSFGRNSDASVFVGASRSKAGPYILLLLRITRREMAICEHACSDPSAVHPTFAPSSQRIYFQSDRNGKMAIYTMAVERLVEKTDT
jgi:oligogalacturonide lyase